LKLKENVSEPLLSSSDRKLFKEAWEITRARHGNAFTFYLPGMVRYGNVRGRYPAVSITGDRCLLQCEHCRGKLLEPMFKADQPEALLEAGLKLARKGAQGLLLTGGSDCDGRLPWGHFLSAIEEIGEKTELYLSAHTGFSDVDSCARLKSAGVQQGLLDVMGDDQTAASVYHLEGLKPVLKGLESIKQGGLELVPHVVAGLQYGRIAAEKKALEIIRSFSPDALVVVVLTPLKGTPMAGVSYPDPVEIGRLIALARKMMPDIPISLGCERPRNRDGWLMEKLAIRAGANRMAVWSESAIREAHRLGLKPRFQSTCCSLQFRGKFSFDFRNDS
jgi:uncharacterized radical SAM superfamily protein